MDTPDYGKTTKAKAECWSQGFITAVHDRLMMSGFSARHYLEGTVEAPSDNLQLHSSKAVFIHN